MMNICLLGHSFVSGLHHHMSVDHPLSPQGYHIIYNYTLGLYLSARFEERNSSATGDDISIKGGEKILKTKLDRHDKKVEIIKKG